jgi:DNA-binding MarR family transcriptional regulator
MTAVPSHPVTSSRTATELWHVLRTIVLDNERRQEACETLDLSFTRVKALLLLAGGPTTQRDLTAALGSDAAYITLVLDELERRELVVRAPDPGDRRRKLVTITATGREAARRARAILATPPAALADLPEAELAALLATLQPVAVASADPGSVSAAWR